MEDTTSKIKKYIIKNCPIGQTKDAFNDLSKLIPDFSTDAPEIQAAMKEFNEEHLAIAKGENNYKYVISQPGALDSYYIDQKTDQKHLINHIEGKIISSEPLDLPVDETVQKYRNELEKYLLKYRDNFFKEQDFAVYVYGDGDANDFNFYLAISAKNFNFKNFYGGEWISEWKLTKHNLTGKIRIYAHYFEDGNIQLKENKIFEENLNLSGEDPAQESEYVVSLIQKFESRMQEGLDQIYSMMKETLFKAMRRVLPVTGEKMDWNIGYHKVISNLKQ